MATTPIDALPYPALTDNANGPAAFAALANKLDGKIVGGKPVRYVLGWAATSYPATQNVNIATQVVNPAIGPYIAIIHAGGVFNAGAGSNGSLRLTVTGVGQVASDVLNPSKPSAQAFRMHPVPGGGSITVNANLEVLAGTIATFADATHAFLEIVCIPV